MRFWDSSALVAVCVDEPNTPLLRRMLEEAPGIGVWWGSIVECWSAFARLRREELLSTRAEEDAGAILEALRSAWVEILPTEEIRAAAGRLVRVHPLRAPDALQLAAALTWSPSGEVVTFDGRLREAARLEGLAPIP